MFYEEHELEQEQELEDSLLKNSHSEIQISISQ